ncbi:MAG: YggS family pyridoxal phosphate-dependent enzyme [Coprothermobacterota bacterium]|nr:YggS family pyridoxal phosphate-dependent enzyme [Coprothermobacterota bacterium]
MIERIGENLSRVRQEIQEACGRSGRSPSEITLLAVSKGFPAEALTEAAVHGQRLFGENYLKEGSEKIMQLAGLKLSWHFLGHLQRNKARKAASLFQLIHSVDSLELGWFLSEEGQRRERPVPCLLEVNLGHEPCKTGFLPEQLPQALHLFSAPGLEVRGLMAIPPAGVIEAARRHFQTLRVLRDDLGERLGRPLPDLSMGMSDDYPIAVEEGATLVRVGRAIFGTRRRQ